MQFLLYSILLKKNIENSLGNKYYPQVLLHECVYKSVDRL